MNNFVLFLKDAWSELKQVAWLTTPQMIASTWLVVILVMIMAAYLGVVDYIIAHLLGLLV